MGIGKIVVRTAAALKTYAHMHSGTSICHADTKSSIRRAACIPSRQRKSYKFLSSPLPSSNVLFFFTEGKNCLEIPHS